MSFFGSSHKTGSFSALKGVSTALLANLRTRLELLGYELQEEKSRAMRAGFFAFGLAFCGAMVLLLVVVWLTVLFWESRQLLLGILTGVFLLFSVLCFLGLRRATAQPRHIFSDSLAALKDDLATLETAVKDDAPTD